MNKNSIATAALSAKAERLGRKRESTGVQVLQAFPGGVALIVGCADGVTIELCFSPEAMEQLCRDGLRCAQSAREAEEEMRNG